jgi:hypothetical protein
MTSTRKRHATAAIAMALTFAAGAAPLASADPAPLARAEAATAVASTNSPATNGPATNSPAASSPCSEVCSGHGYGTPSGPVTSSGVSRTIAHATGSDEWAYIGIGAGVAGLALIGVGGAVAVNRRSGRRTTPGRSTIA